MIFVALAAGWWLFRKTLSLVRKLVVVGLTLLITLGIIAASVAIYLMG